MPLSSCVHMITSLSRSFPIQRVVMLKTAAVLPSDFSQITYLFTSDKVHPVRLWDYKYFWYQTVWNDVLFSWCTLHLLLKKIMLKLLKMLCNFVVWENKCVTNHWQLWSHGVVSCFHHQSPFQSSPQGAPRHSFLSHSQSGPRFYHHGK